MHHLSYNLFYENYSDSCRIFVCHALRVLQALLLRCGFPLAASPYRPDWWRAAEADVLLEGSSFPTQKHWSSVRAHLSRVYTQFLGLHDRFVLRHAASTIRPSADGSGFQTQIQAAEFTTHGLQSSRGAPTACTNTRASDPLMTLVGSYS